MNFEVSQLLKVGGAGSTATTCIDRYTCNIGLKYVYVQDATNILWYQVLHASLVPTS